ncbi:hypothetical protein E2C01_050957 [Portunus trituberculatus]|uniref:Uncharacterized protein n=1 Tax=Portunus trituberculatus TaxID=210409 RepID=A0A5B7GHH5_PORTR|nr:hypothetical protein [Portunus trituberculatus]
MCTWRRAAGGSSSGGGGSGGRGGSGEGGGGGGGGVTLQGRDGCGRRRGEGVLPSARGATAVPGAAAPARGGPRQPAGVSVSASPK